jgi:hypothetical protein
MPDLPQAELQPQSRPPSQRSVFRRVRESRTTIVWIILFLVLYVVGTFLPEGFNWRLNFSRGVLPSWWVPWARPLISLLNLPLVFSLTLIAIAIHCYRRSKSFLPALLAVLSLPTLWSLFLGEVAGLPLAGLLCLPWAVPVVLLKPQLAAFALLSRRKWFLAACMWLLLSLVIWGPWPLDLLFVQSSEWKAMHPQDISLFPWGVLIAAPLMWFSRGDEDLLMAAGSFATPHLFPYHFILLMPSLARMSPPWMLGTWLLSWTPLLANWLGPEAWHFGNLIGLSFWLGIKLRKSQLPGPAAPNPTTTISPDNAVLPR